MKQILIVEDDNLLNKTLTYNLELDGYTITSVLNARTAAESLKTNIFDLVLLDINLPDGNGYDLCRLIKPEHPDTVVIFLTANDQESDQIRGYEAGAVDYITKPFSISALQRKIKAMFAMLEHHKPAKDIYEDGSLFLDFSEQFASLNGKPLALSAMEYKMLNLFLKNPKQVLTRQQLLERLWDIDEKYVDEHTLTTSISRIRSKIEADGDTYIKTVYGIPNPHFHVMTTMRPLNPDGTWGQKQRREYLLDEDGNRIRDKNGDYMFNAVHTTDWHEPETLEHWREQWAAAVNTKFEEKGLDVRIDHRSYVRQGLDLIPTVHEGANVRQMEAKGIRTEKGELNRWIKATNRLMQDVRKKIKALFVWMAEVKEELSKPQTPSLADLLIAYYNQRNAGAWSNKARTGNLKQFAEAVNYLTENKLLTLEDLQERLSSVNEEFEALSDSMKKKSARIKELQELIREGENYQRLKPVHTELNNIKFKKQREKFETSHDAELRLFYAARRILKEKLDGKPIALKAWKQEYAQLKTEYAELSPQHKPLREEVIRLRQVQNAVDTALRRREQPQAVQRKKHEMEL